MNTTAPVRILGKLISAIYMRHRPELAQVISDCGHCQRKGSFCGTHFVGLRRDVETLVWWSLTVGGGVILVALSATGYFLFRAM